MFKLANTKSGFTLVEVLVSTALIVMFLPAIGNLLTNSQLLASISKHKIQAAYLAELIMEKERQLPFANISSQPATNYPLDTKGVYNNTSGYYYATVTITVTPAVYTSASGVQTINATIDHVVLQISWLEQITKSPVTITEDYTGDIANDKMLN